MLAEVPSAHPSKFNKMVFLYGHNALNPTYQGGLKSAKETMLKSQYVYYHEWWIDKASWKLLQMEAWPIQLLEIHWQFGNW